MKKKKKIISILLILSVLINVTFVRPIDTAAGSSDVLGIDSGKIYYIKNTVSGLYLDVKEAINSNGQEVVACVFNGNKNQQWKVNRNSNGTYTLVAVFSSNGKVLDVSGSKLDIYAPGYPSDQQFKISAMLNGSYKILLGSKCLSQNQTPYSGTTNYKINLPTTANSYSYWSFESINKNDADIYSFKYPAGTGYSAYDSTGKDSVFVTNTNNMGYYGFAIPNSSAANALNFMKGDSIWVHNGHGGPGVVHFGTATNGNNGSIGITEINNLSANVLSNLKVFITTGCKSGKNTNALSSHSGNNLINAVFSKGAHFAIGWENDVSMSAGVTWIKTFFEEANKGKTVEQCIYEANKVASLGTVYCLGDKWQKLK